MRKLILFTLLLLPAAAMAEQKCEHSQPRNLQLDLAGVKAVVFDIGPHDLRIDAARGAKGALQGRACASDADALARLTLTQHKSGDKLVVKLRREGERSGIFFGNHYAYLNISGSVPDNIPVQLKVGSGDAIVSGAASLSADVGSGDVQARRIRGQFTAAVGSGDIDAVDIGALHVLSVGSGDVTVKHVRGASKIGSIGSGDLALDNTQGRLEIGSIGSGDAEVRDIGGSIAVDSIGSGDFAAEGVRGDLVVHSTGSGSVHHSGVTGRVDLPAKR